MNEMRLQRLVKALEGVSTKRDKERADDLAFQADVRRMLGLI